MKTYYCEIKGNETNPHFPGYKICAETDVQAVERFKVKHGARLELVYDEDFKIIWEAT